MILAPIFDTPRAGTPLYRENLGAGKIYFYKKLDMPLQILYNRAEGAAAPSWCWGGLKLYKQFIRLFCLYISLQFNLPK